MHALAWANQGCSKKTLLKRAGEWRISLGKDQRWTYEQYEDILKNYGDCQNNAQFVMTKVRKLVAQLQKDAAKEGRETTVTEPTEDQLTSLQYLFDNIRLTEKLKCKIKFKSLGSNSSFQLPSTSMITRKLKAKITSRFHLQGT